MKRIQKLLKNLKYISKFDLRKSKAFEFSYEETLENILYYIPNSDIKRPNVLNAEQTLDALCNGNKSVVRFGDGEITIISGKDISFQKYEKVLAQRMAEILKSENDNIMVGINHWYFHPTYDSTQNNTDKKFGLFTMPPIRRKMLNLINMEKEYCDAAFTGMFGKKNPKTDKAYEKIRSIWNNKNILLVGCKEAHSQYKFDLFDNAARSKWLYIPNKNAFSEYDNILNQICKYPKDTIIILMAGPTAKLLAYDLANDGYRALDLGHIAKSYDWYCRQVEITDKSVMNFWGPDE